MRGHNNPHITSLGKEKGCQSCMDMQKALRKIGINLSDLPYGLPKELWSAAKVPFIARTMGKAPPFFLNGAVNPEWRSWQKVALVKLPQAMKDEENKLRQSSKDEREAAARSLADEKRRAAEERQLWFAKAARFSRLLVTSDEFDYILDCRVEFGDDFGTNNQLLLAVPAESKVRRSNVVEISKSA